MAEIEARAITARIQRARKEAGLNQPQMARKLNVIPRTYQNYESQKRPRVPWSELDKIAKITRTTTQWLIHGEAPDIMGTLNGEDSRAMQRVEEKLDALLVLEGVDPTRDVLPQAVQVHGERVAQAKKESRPASRRRSAAKQS